MKLVVDKVNYGLVPYGPGTGTRALGIYFSTQDGDFTYEAEKDEKGNPITDNKVVINAAGLLQDVLNQIKEKKYELPWANFLLGREYVYFIGTELASPDFRPIIANLFEGLSHMALEVQKKSFENIEDEKKLAAAKKQLHAPMPVFVGSPKYYTGKDQFYENFNIILLQLPLEENTKPNLMSMVEVANHAFSTFVIKMDKEGFDKEKEALKTIYEDSGALSLPTSRIFIVDKDGSDDIAQYALDKGYRINHVMNYSDKYQLNF